MKLLMKLVPLAVAYETGSLLGLERSCLPCNVSNQLPGVAFGTSPLVASVWQPPPMLPHVHRRIAAHLNNHHRIAADILVQYYNNWTFKKAKCPSPTYPHFWEEATGKMPQAKCKI